jgi:hypothetical protein|tara:strand:- start:12123 stop:12254 length:132 start_codon:yes stop_codon:yes gene_type:complete
MAQHPESPMLLPPISKLFSFKNAPGAEMERAIELAPFAPIGFA